MSSRVVFFFRFAIALSFLAASVAVYFYRNLLELSPMQIYAFSGLLFIYGLFRVHRAYRAAENVI